jgi:hypothetical protein
VSRAGTSRLGFGADISHLDLTRSGTPAAYRRGAADHYTVTYQLLRVLYQLLRVSYQSLTVFYKLLSALC